MGKTGLYKGLSLALLFLASGAQAVETTSPPAGNKIYHDTCASCHEKGLLGAPRFGNAADWEARLKQGRDVLLNHAVSGFKAMPAAGGNASLTSPDVAAAVDYMLNPLSPANTGDKAIDAESNLLDKQKAFFRHAKRGRAFVYPMDKDGYFSPPPMEELPDDKYGDEVRLGYRIFTQTQEYAARYAGRGLVCSNCHLNAGRKPHAIPLWGAAGMYPGYRFSSDKNDTLEDRMADCFRNSMNGIAPAPDSPEMRALLAYANFISKGIPIGVHMPGRSFPDIDYTGYEASPARGKDIYQTKCQTCHGNNGQGKSSADGGYEIPPLWGFNSYNKGASLYKQRMLARFIRANMPLNQGFSLSEQEAWDVASFVNIHERPKSPAKGIWQELFASDH